MKLGNHVTAGLALIVGLAGCGSTTGSLKGQIEVKPEALGPFQCVSLGSVAAAPAQGILVLGLMRGEERMVVEHDRRPLLAVKTCGKGKVPVSKTPARSTVAKGNPLLGRIDRPVEDFFAGPTSGESNRGSLRPIDKVYYIGPGPDGARHGSPPDPPPCNGTYYYGACYYYGPASYARTADGGGMTMRVERPAFSGDGHSLDEIAVQGGTGNGNIVELGWNVSPSQYSDSDPHLFVYHWVNWVGTCYDTCGWHQVSSTYFPGMNLAAIKGRDVYVGYVHYQGNWWAWFDNQWLGYFADSEWSGSYTQSSLIQWFGELATNNGTPPNVEMGDGLFPTDPGAAPMATLCDVDATAWVCWYRDLQSLGPNYPAYYDIRRTGFGETGYGGPGH
ncbi:MAG TPA: neprosin family prolyl endopeptidase [Thermoanaerobaculaceae bacterium]|nr:neprosin family prolyl endopeptidase [Thermoanaerobaculaceae bacterium]